MRLRLSTLLVSMTLAACGAGAGGSGGSRLPNGDRAVAALEVSDDAFPAAVRDLLASEPGSRDRQTRLAGGEARQRGRASAGVKGHAPHRGPPPRIGGLQLIRMGELQPEMLGPGARDAFRGAAKELSTRGDEGR